LACRLYLARKMNKEEQNENLVLKSARNDTANAANNLQTTHLPWKLLGLVGLISVTYFAVCGGAYGLEQLVYAVGPGWAIVAVFLTPVLWSLPISLMVAELASAIPEQGGYYVWVREGLGPFWATQIGWLVLCGAAVNSAIYPVMFVNYLSYFYPSLAQLPRRNPRNIAVCSTTLAGKCKPYFSLIRLEIN